MIVVSCQRRSVFFLAFRIRFALMNESLKTCATTEILQIVCRLIISAAKLAILSLFLANSGSSKRQLFAI